MMPKRISSRFARLATEPDTYSAKSLDYFEEGIADVIGRRSVAVRTQSRAHGMAAIVQDVDKAEKTCKDVYSAGAVRKGLPSP